MRGNQVARNQVVVARGGRRGAHLNTVLAADAEVERRAGRPPQLPGGAPHIVKVAPGRPMAPHLDIRDRAKRAHVLRVWGGGGGPVDDAKKSPYCGSRQTGPDKTIGLDAAIGQPGKSGTH